jgi:hypothetical protein
MAQERTKKRVLNAERANLKATNLKSATNGLDNVGKRLVEQRKAYKDGQSRKAQLEERASKGKTTKERAAAKEEAEKLESELAQQDKEMKDAEAEEAMLKQREKEANKVDEYLDKEMEDPENPNNPNNPKKTTEGNDALIAALLARTALSDHLVPLDVSLGAGLGEHEKVISYKNGLGKVGIIYNTEIEGWLVYRIRRNVVIGDKVPNIIKDRRASTPKDEETRTKWGWSNALAVRGIAIAVPSEYEGNAEDLVVPVQRYSAIEKQEMKEAKKPIPKQVDVQVLIE